MYAELLDWPRIPEELIEYDLSKIRLLKDCSPYPTYDLFRQYKIVDKNLIEYLQQFFDFDVSKHSYYQVIKDGIATHIDKDRTIAYNYLINSGGNNVYTVWCENDKVTETFKISIPIKTWHKLDVSTYHTVKGIDDTRIAISVFNLE